jgi:hypothetical protein
MGVFKNCAVLSAGALLSIGSAFAENIAVLSNNLADAAAADFNTNIPQHTFTAFTVGGGPPDLPTLQSFDAILLFEDGWFSEAPNVGDRVAEYANAGGSVILGTFYNQDRSDSTSGGGNGWGNLELIDPNTSDGVGTSYDGDTLDAASIVAHPLTVGVTSLFSGSDGYSGGNEAKPGTVVLALWENFNALGNPDPAIAYRITGAACVIHIGIAPQYANYGTLGTDFGGDFYQVWSNAFDFAVDGEECSATLPPPVPPVPPAPPAPPEVVPTMSAYGLVLTILGLLSVAARRLRASAKRD